MGIVAVAVFCVTLASRMPMAKGVHPGMRG